MASSNGNGNISQAMAFWLISLTLLMTVHGRFFRMGTLPPPQGTELGGKQGLEGTKSPTKSLDKPNPNLEDTTELKRVMPTVTGGSKDQNELENGKPEEVNAKEKLPLADSGKLKNQNADENSNLGVKKPQETPRRAASNPETAKDKAKEEKKLEKEIKVLVDKNEPELSKDAGEPVPPVAASKGGDDYELQVQKFNELLKKAVEQAGTKEKKAKFLKDLIDRYHLFVVEKENVDPPKKLAEDRRVSVELLKEDKTLKKEIAEAGGKLSADKAEDKVKKPEDHQQNTMVPGGLDGEARGANEFNTGMNANAIANEVVIDPSQGASAGVNLANNSELPENTAQGAQNAKISSANSAPLNRREMLKTPDGREKMNDDMANNLSKLDKSGQEKKDLDKKADDAKGVNTNIGDVRNGPNNIPDQQKTSTAKISNSANAASSSVGPTSSSSDANPNKSTSSPKDKQMDSGMAGAASSSSGKTSSSSVANANKSNPSSSSNNKQMDTGTVNASRGSVVTTSTSSKSNPSSKDTQMDSGISTATKPTNPSTNEKPTENGNPPNLKPNADGKKLDKPNDNDNRNVADKKKNGDSKSNGTTDDKNDTKKKAGDNKRNVSAPTTVVEKKNAKSKVKDKGKAEKVKKVKSNAGADMDEDSADSDDVDDDKSDGKNAMDGKKGKGSNKKLHTRNGKATVSRVASEG